MLVEREMHCVPRPWIDASKGLRHGLQEEMQQTQSASERVPEESECIRTSLGRYEIERGLEDWLRRSNYAMTDDLWRSDVSKSRTFL
jgi:hypothetical protein